MQALFNLKAAVAAEAFYFTDTEEQAKFSSGSLVISACDRKPQLDYDEGPGLWF